MDRIAIIYCRVSTDNQEREGTSLDSQLEACKKLAQERGYDDSKQLVVMEAYSGLVLDRPKLNEVREYVRNKKVGAFIAYTLDRISRNPVHFIILQEELERNGVELIPVTEDIDGSDLGRLITYIKFYSAKLEVEKIKERTLRGKRHRAEMGDIPSGFGRYGYWGLRYNAEQKRFDHIPGQIDVVKEILTSYAAGKSSGSITVNLQKQGILSSTGGRIHRSAINRVLSHANVYAGHLKWNGYSLLDKVQPIISEEIAGIIARKLQRNKELSYGFGRRKPLTSRVFCGLCGRRYSLDANKGCRCNGSDPRNPTACCAPKVGLKKLTDCVFEALAWILSDNEALLERTTEVREQWERQAAEIEEKRREKETRLAKFDQRRRLLSIQHELGGLTNDEYQDRLKDIKEEKAQLTEQIEQLASFTSAEEPPRPEDVREAIQALSSVREQIALMFLKALPLIKVALTKGDEQQKQIQELVEKLDIKVVINPGENGQQFKLDVLTNIPIKKQEVSNTVTVSPSPGYCVFLPPLSPELSWHALDP